METNKLILGGIYKVNFSDSLTRILVIDDFEVMYDTLWKDNKWGISDNLKGTTAFYRIPYDFFLSNSEFIETKELSEKEYRIFRPDLPLRFGRTNIVNWDTIDDNSLKLLEARFNNETIKLKEIVLENFGKKGGNKKGEKITSDNFLKVIDIIKKASKIRSSSNNNYSNGSGGIGIYRSGYSNQIPSYYIGEFNDLAGIVLRYPILQKVD